MEKVTIKMARVKVGLSQEQMAELLGTSRPTYANYESYDTPMRIDVAIKFSEITGFNIDQIIFLKNNYTSNVVSTTPEM